MGGKNGRWSTLLNLYGYHSLGTAYYYLFTTFLQSCSCAVFCIWLAMSLWPCVGWVNLTQREVLYRGPANAPPRPSRYLVITSLSIYSLLTVGAYKYVLNRHHGCQNVQNGCLRLVVWWKKKEKNVWFWKETCFLLSDSPVSSNSLSLSMKTNHCEHFSHCFPPRRGRYCDRACINVWCMLGVGGWQGLEIIHIASWAPWHPSFHHQRLSFYEKKSVFFTFIFSDYFVVLHHRWKK